MEFHVGDRVVLIKPDRDNNQSLYVGATGTVCVVDRRVGVEWDEQIVEGHSCSDHCEYGHGWFVDKDYLSLIFSDGELIEQAGINLRSILQ